MSAPDPKAWAPEPWEVSEVAMQSDSEFGDNDESGIVDLCETVARRRAIEELKALISETYEPYVNQHYGGPAPTLLNADVIFSRIAAIEAEEA